MTNIPLRLNLNSKMLGSETTNKRSLVRALVTLRESFIAFCDTTQTNTQLRQWWPQLMSLRLTMSPRACCRRKYTQTTFLAYDSAQVACTSSRKSMNTDRTVNVKNADVFDLRASICFLPLLKIVRGKNVMEVIHFFNNTIKISFLLENYRLLIVTEPLMMASIWSLHYHIAAK